MFELNQRLAQDCFIIAESSLNLLLLMDDQQYPWFILVPKRHNIKEIFELNPQDQAQLNHESTMLAKALSDGFKAEKLNIAALGNMVPQLHIHHIVRATTDPAWPKPVWGVLPAKPYDTAAKHHIIKKLQDTTISDSFTFKPL